MSINRKTKILVATYGFFPAQNYGGPPVSIENFCNAMSECEVYVVARNHEMGENKPLQGINNGWNKRCSCSVRYLSDAEYNTDNLGGAMDEVKPDLVYIQTFFEYRTFISSIRAACKRKIPVLLAPRGELLMGAMKKKYKKLPYIWLAKVLWLRGKVFYQATSDEEYASILHYLTKENDRVFNLSNFPCVVRETDFASKESYEGPLKVVTITRIVPKKNVLYACEVMMDVKAEIIWDIYGPIEDEEYWNNCLCVIEKLPKNIHVTYKGSIPHEMVFATLRRYQVYFFPTQSENYGHSIVEAMLAGCIPIISNNTPWNDLYENNAGFSIDLSDKLIFCETIDQLALFSVDKLIETSNNVMRYIHSHTSVERLKEQYIKSILKMIKQHV